MELKTEAEDSSLVILWSNGKWRVKDQIALSPQTLIMQRDTTLERSPLDRKPERAIQAKVRAKKKKKKKKKRKEKNARLENPKGRPWQKESENTRVKSLT